MNEELGILKPEKTDLQIRIYGAKRDTPQRDLREFRKGKPIFIVQRSISAKEISSCSKRKRAKCAGSRIRELSGP